MPAGDGLLTAAAAADDAKDASAATSAAASAASTSTPIFFRDAVVPTLAYGLDEGLGFWLVDVQGRSVTTKVFAFAFAVAFLLDGSGLAAPKVGLAALAVEG